MKQYEMLIVKYVGARGKTINLQIDEFPNDFDLILQIQDDTYQPEWKTSYLDMIYKEQLNNRRNERYENRAYIDDFTYEDAKYFSSKEGCPEEVITDETVLKLLENLTPIQKKRVQLVIIEGMSYTDVARLEEVDESAVRRSVKEGLKKLKNILNDRPNL